MSGPQSFNLVPDSQAYVVTYGNEVVATSLPGGLPRTRADFVGAAHTVTCQFTCGALSFNYLQAFYRTGTSRASQPFLAQLAIDNATLDTYLAKFVPGSWVLASQAGLTYVVQVSLWVMPNLVSTTLDQQAIDLYNAGNDPALYNALSYLTNNVMPVTI